jgi:hypothetical protein
MQTEDLRDRNNRVIGRIITRSDGVMEIRDPVNRLKGTYHPKTNETRDPVNRLVGKGNLLATLLG